VQIAEVKDREPFEIGGKVLPHDVVVPDLDTLSIPLPAPIQSRQLEDGSNCGLDGIPVFWVKEVNTLTEYLCFMIAFDPEALSSVNSAQAFSSLATISCSVNGPSCDIRWS
jgi:hypothetical protein